MASEVVTQLALGIGSSVISGGAVWLAQRARSRGRARARRRFLGLSGRAECRIVVGSDARHPRAVHRRDMAAMLELAGLLRTVGVTPRVLSAQEAAAEGVDAVELCVAFSDANLRTGAHLRRYLPGVAVAAYRAGSRTSLELSVGGQRYPRNDRAVYAILARICRPDRPHLFLLAGQTGVASHAAALFLTERMAALRGRYADDRSFCLLLRVPEPATYGPYEVEEVADVTAAARSAQRGVT